MHIDPARRCQDVSHGLFSSQSQSLHGSLIYRRITPLQVITAQDNRPQLQQLLDHWRQAQPLAGPDYWATRVWTLITWQAIYLSICAAHISHHHIDVRSVRQCIQDGVVMGYGLGPSAFSSANEHSPSSRSLLAAIAAPLRELIDSLYADLSALVKINKANSYGLMADCVMHALLALMKENPQWQHPQLISLGNAWCAQLGLMDRTGQAMSRLVSIELENKADTLTLARKACCKHYLLDPNDICGSCARLNWRQRLQILNTSL